MDDYGEWARRAEFDAATAEASDVLLARLGLGLVSDAAEVAGLVGRRLREGTLDRDHLAYELGDVAYYWARLCAVAGVTPSEVLARSRRNIEARLAKRAQPS
ncbi:MAG: pyrophosphatase [Alphaproteobacteria bacterium]|nr:pyrophosphatase [Alphaproteobacteria bacterium]